VCGYAIEIALKTRICHTLKWHGFPSTRKEFLDRRKFKTHSLDLLLTHSGVESKIKTGYLADWSIVKTWNPESRYREIESARGSPIDGEVFPDCGTLSPELQRLRSGGRLIRRVVRLIRNYPFDCCISLHTL
jgi:hypothetical protein